MTKIVTEAMLPCPFCGSAKAFVSEADRDIVALVYVACGDCGAGGPGVDEDDFPIEKAIRAKAIAAWNTRSTAQEPALDDDAELRERVRDFIYDCTKDEFNTGWTLSAHQADDVIAMIANRLQAKAPETGEG